MILSPTATTNDVILLIFRDVELSKIAEDFISLNLKNQSSRLFDQSGILKNIIEDMSALPIDDSIQNETSVYESFGSTTVSPNVSRNASTPSNNTTQLSGVFKLQDQMKENNSNNTSQSLKSSQVSAKSNLGMFAIETKTNGIKNKFQNQIPTVSPSISKTNSQLLSQNMTPPKSVVLEGSFNSPPKAGLFTFNSTLTTTPAVSSEPVTFGTPKSSPNKGFSFSSLATTQPFTGTLTTSSQAATSPAFPSFNKPFSFGTTSEQGQTTAITTVSTPFQIAPSKNTLLETTTSAFSSPLSSLGALVSGIEPLKSDSGTLSPNKGLPFTIANVSPSQSSEFKLSGISDNNSQISIPISNQNTNIFGLAQNKLDSGNLTSTQSGSAFKNFSFDTSSSQKSVFGGFPPFTPPKKEEGKPNETPKKPLLPSPKTDEIKTDEPLKTAFSSSSLSFGTSSNAFSISSSPQPQKSFFGSSTFASSSVFNVEKTSETVIKPVVTVSDSKSPIIEISLNPTKIDGDIKLPKGITITKVDSSEKKDLELQNKPDSGSNAESHGSLSFDPFQTPTKSPQTIFGGSASPKTPLMYEVAEADDGTGPEVKADENPEAPLTQETVQVTTPPTTSAPAFSFSIAPISKPENSETQPNKPFTFDLKSPVTTSASSAPETSLSVTSSQTSSQSTNSTFSFSIPETNIPTSTTTTSFGFGSLSFSDNSSKTGFSFGQSSETSSSAKNIFGGFGSTTTSESSNTFGQSPAVSGENKSLFGQQSTETKSVFGTPATAAEKPSTFSFSLPATTTTATASPFFNSPATTASSFFGQPICSPVSTTSSPFGQSSTSVFGSQTPQPFGGTSGFGSKPAFGQSGGSFFSQTG